MNRFATLPVWAARLLLAAVALCIAYGVLASAPESVQPAGRAVSGASADAILGDAALYLTVADRVRSGESYYAAVAEEHRARGYPLRPFLTVRPPALAHVIAGVGGLERARLLMLGLAMLAAIAMVFRLRTVLTARIHFPVLAFLAAVIAGYSGKVALFHEAWAAVLIGIALAIRTERLWLPSVLLATGAVVLRELAMPVLPLLALLAWREGRRVEAVCWLASLAFCAVTLAVHATRVNALAGAADLSSPSWLALGGWPFVLRMVRENSALEYVAPWVCAAAVPLGLLGWCWWKHPFADRVACYLLGFIAAFMVLGRSNNDYWGLLLVPFLLFGLALAPVAVSAALDAARIKR